MEREIKMSTTILWYYFLVDKSYRAVTITLARFGEWYKLTRMTETDVDVRYYTAMPKAYDAVAKMIEDLK